MTAPHDTGPDAHHAPKSRRGGRAFAIFLAVCVALLLADLLYHRHVVHPIEGWFGFYGVYGFVACVALVLAARAMRRVLMRDEDYYDGV